MSVRKLLQPCFFGGAFRNPVAEATGCTLKRAPHIPPNVAHASACRGELQFAVSMGAAALMKCVMSPFSFLCDGTSM